MKSELDYPLSMVGPNTSFFGSFQLFQNLTRCPSPIPFLSQAGKRAPSFSSVLTGGTHLSETPCPRRYMPTMFLACATPSSFPYISRI
jgi:hypothetical protein